MPTIQSQIEQAANALSRSRGRPHLHVETAKELGALNESVSDKAELVHQVAIFATGPSEQHPMAALAILRALELPPILVVRVLAPYLDADDPKLRSFVRDWFQGHDNCGPGDNRLKPVNFEDYAKYVQMQQLNVPAAFIDYVYGRSPGRALLVFARGDRRAEAEAALQLEAKEVEAARHGREVPAIRGEGGLIIRRTTGRSPQPVDNREIEIAERVISHAIALKTWENGKLLSEAKAQLAMLAERDEWWVRRYVEEVQKRHPELRP